jgi:hypothetical protein
MNNTNSFIQPRRSGLNPDQYKIIRNRGSIEQGVAESDILREISYVLQNISGNFILYENGYYNIRGHINVTETVRRIVSELSDIGWLYKKITEEFKV